MEIEFIVHDKDDVIAVVYKHNTLGRVVVLKNSIVPDSILYVASMNGTEEKSVDIKEFILSVIPREEKNEN